MKKYAMPALAISAIIAAISICAAAASAQSHADGVSACAGCHDVSASAFMRASASILDADKKDVHVLAGVSCAGCHAEHSARRDEGAKPGIETCKKCHPQSSESYESGIHFEAFSQLGMPQCAVCHPPHRMEKPSPDYAHRAEPGFSAKPGECLSCHFEKSPIAGLVAKYAEGRMELESSAKKLDGLSEKLTAAEKWLPVFLRPKSRPQKTGGDYISMARAAMHAGGGDVLNLLSDCRADSAEFAGLISDVRLKIFLLYGGGLILTIAVLVIAPKPASRRRRIGRNSSRTPR